MYSLVGEQHCLQPLDALVTNKNETPPHAKSDANAIRNMSIVQAWPRGAQCTELWSVSLCAIPAWPNTGGGERKHGGRRTLTSDEACSFAGALQDK